MKSSKSGSPVLERMEGKGYMWKGKEGQGKEERAEDRVSLVREARRHR